MANAVVKKLNELDLDREKMRECYPAFDERVLFSLERRHLDLPAFTNVLMANPEAEGAPSLTDHLRDNVRLFKVDEFAFDDEEDIHLPGVESVLSSMRTSGHSLLFIVQGNATTTSVYAGLSKFDYEAIETSSVSTSYQAAWKANFPGSAFVPLSTDSIRDNVSYPMANCEEFGVLTGVPSLKREESAALFVQGLERLIRAMRGKVYTWISIADPIPQSAIWDAIGTCQQMETDLSGHIKTTLSKAVSKSNTIMLGLFGMAGEGKTDGTSDAKSETTSHQAGSSTADTVGDTHTTSNTVGGSVSGGASVGFLGTGGHAEASADYHRTWGDAHSVAKTIGTSVLDGIAKGWVNTVSRSISSQFGGGAFSSFGRTWTNTTTVGQEQLNRKVEYAIEVLKNYEKRLHEGTAIGMWNLGHYFCAADKVTYQQGIGVVTSLFTGMDSTFEPPRAIHVPKEFRDTLRRFQNVYLRFPTRESSMRDVRTGTVELQDHPLGIFFNGPATPVSTRELAIATPVATQDIEGVSVSRRPAFGINLPQVRKTDSKTLTLGWILDKGNETPQTYRISQSNLPKHVSVFGLTGSGKTNTVQRLLHQLWKNEHIPFLVIEPAKAEYRAMSRYEELKDDLLVFSAGVEQNDACPLRLNPFDFNPGRDRDANRVHLLTHIDRLKATFNASFPMYASMPYILEEAMLEIYRERGWELGRSTNRFVGDIYRDDFSGYVPTLRDLYWKVDDIVRRKAYAPEQTMNIRAALKARLSSLMVGAKGEMFNCRASVPMQDLFSRPAVIELENMGDDDEKAFLMGLIVSRLYEYRKATYGTEGEKSLKHVLVIEEAHRLLANVPDTSANMEAGNPKGKSVSAFVDMLSEIRAFGESVFVVDQLPSRVAPNIVKGTGTKLVHRLLAKDDRESVGWTMGMNDAQIADLSLLKTGECVASQDGDSKAYLCKVPKCDEHEHVWEAEASSATMDYRAGHVSLFAHPDASVDREDGAFKDSLYKAMLAVGCGEDASILERIKPSRVRGIWTARGEWLSMYWEQVCAELWHEHGGSFGSFVSMKKTGYALLIKQKGALASYREAFAHFMQESILSPVSSTEGIAGVAFEPLMLRLSVLEKVNSIFSTERGKDRCAALADAIRKVLLLLEPSGIKYGDSIRERMAMEIVVQIPGHAEWVEPVLAKLREGGH